MASLPRDANSTNSTPETSIRGGIWRVSIEMSGSARATWSIRFTSERWPSTATVAGRLPRNWSLKISRLSGPS